MKKSLINILILALVVTNVILSAVLVFTIVPTMKKTDNLITKIVSAIDLELEHPIPGSEETTISIDKIEVYDIEKQLLINLKKGEDGLEHYVVLYATLSLDASHKDYETYYEMLPTKESLITSEIISIVSGYTIDEARDNMTDMKSEILLAVQTLYKSEFIIDVSFRDITFQ